MDIEMKKTNINEDDCDDYELPPLNSSNMYNSSIYNNINNTNEESESNNLIEEDNLQEHSDIDYNLIWNSILDYKKSYDVSMMTKKCCFCHKISILRNMFKLEDDKLFAKEIWICLKCSSNISESRKLIDWEIEPKTIKTKICKRCNKKKSLYKFYKVNKYCDYCLLKKKWARMRVKMEYNTNNEENDNYNRKTTSKRNEYVECCFCNEKMKISESFKYFECSDDVCSHKYVCLNCSINVKDWRCLKDWEEECDIRNGRICCRCKKLKSGCRFKNGKSGCEYCSLKRKRIYMINKK